MGQYQTFVVRLWTDAAENAVRGHIQHIASRRGIYFRDAERMLQFIREHLDPVALPMGSGEDGWRPDGELQPQPADRGEADDR